MTPTTEAQAVLLLFLFLGRCNFRGSDLSRIFRTTPSRVLLLTALILLLCGL